MPDDPFAASVASFAETMRRQTAILDDLKTMQQEAQTMHRDARRDLRSLRFLECFAIALLGLALVGTGFLVWVGFFSHYQEQALLDNSRAIAAQVQLLREQLNPR